jgi:hypothetical protein
LLSLFSVQNDADLLPYFLEHYDALGCDNNVIFLHDGPSAEENELCGKAVTELGWKVRHVSSRSSFGEGELRRALFDSFRRAASPEDYILCANADEFQVWEEPPSHAAGEGFDLVVGRLEDRFNDALTGIEEGATLEASYPISHPHLSKVLFPRRPRLRDKIVMAKVRIPVNYQKSIHIESKTDGLRVTGNIPIHHYKWREGLLERLRTRTDYTPEEIQSIKSFFTPETERVR